MKSGASKQSGINIFSLMGLIIIGFLCILYTLFYRYFAQVHIQLPFLKFPIFVGEQTLFVCFILLVLKWKVQPLKDKRIYWILVVYFIWLLIKALHGYITYGPYAFRNAALFYYPIFAVFGFYFYDKRLFSNQPFLYVLLILFLIFFKVKVFSFYRYINVFFISFF